jgi:hypothetical protein
VVWYTRALERSVREPAAELRQVEAERLDVALQRAMAIILDPASPDIRAREAVDKVARLTELRARLLGFFHPVKASIAVQSPSSTTRDIDDTITTFAGGAGESSDNRGQVTPPGQPIAPPQGTDSARSGTWIRSPATWMRNG